MRRLAFTGVYESDENFFDVVTRSSVMQNVFLSYIFYCSYACLAARAGFFPTDLPMDIRRSGLVQLRPIEWSC